MVWRSDAPQGLEAAKVRFDLVPYMHGVVLDLGCGPQKIFNAPNIIGVDDDRDVKLFGIKANPDVRWNCTKLDLYADGFADTVFSSHLLEHVVDYQAALAEWWRLLKPGGHLILYLPHADHYPNIGMPGANPDHKHDFRNEDIAAAMRAVALESGHGWVQLADEVRSQGFEYSFLQIYRKTREGGWSSLVASPKPDKTLGLVRLGAHGDALWLSAVLPGLKAQGWHITLYTQRPGESSLRHDPHIDRMIVQPDGIFGPAQEDVAWQAAYWLHEEKKYDKFINLTGCIERDLLVHPSEFRFYFSQQQRHQLMNKNYLEVLHAWCDVPFDRHRVRVKFHPSPDEIKWALTERAKYDGPLVVINPTGSSLPKFWPHTQRLMERLDAAGVHSIVVGELRGQELAPPARARVIGTDWDIRKVYTLACLADVVVGTESAVVNAVAHEDCAKVVLLSHSSGENLTRDWHNTTAFEPQGLACYPCHRIHADGSHCTMPRGFAACQDAASAEEVAESCLQWIKGLRKEAA